MMTWVPETGPGNTSTASSPTPSAPVPAAALHTYKWTRCVTFNKQCGYHPYPCDPGMVRIPGSGSGNGGGSGATDNATAAADNVWLFYGMEKTCGYSGREFYALGRWDLLAKKFTLLDERSDMGNTLLDGGEGYATMTVEDPRGGGRLIITNAVIEGDRDPSARPGFWEDARGWFGVLSLPKVASVTNFSAPSSWSSSSSSSVSAASAASSASSASSSSKVPYHDVFLTTSPLPELALLRKNETHRAALNQPVLPAMPPSPSPAGGGASSGVAATPPLFQGTSIEIVAEFDRDPASVGWDFGLSVLSSQRPAATTEDEGEDKDNNEDTLKGGGGGRGDEYTRIGVRDGKVMQNTDLWDEGKIE